MMPGGGKAAKARASNDEMPMRSLLLAAMLVALGASTPAGRSARLEAALAQMEAGDYGAAGANLRALADHGSGVAETMLGVMNARGLGGPADPAAASAYFLRAAHRGYPPAQLALARMLLSARGVSPDMEGAYRWALIAHAHGEPAVRTAALEIARAALPKLSRGEAARARRAAAAFRPWAAANR